MSSASGRPPDCNEWFPGSEPDDPAWAYEDAPVFAGRFRMGPSPGAGAMGRVFRAWDTADASEVAVKILHDDLRSEPAVVESFTAECAILDVCRHPSVVECRTSGIDADTGSHYLVMEYHPWTLQRWAGRIIPWRRAVEWMSQVCAAIAHAHSLGIVHRDIKPSNLLLTRDMRAKVCDFGAAVTLDDGASHSPPARGHRAEAALHELRRQVNAKPASDIKSLGLIFYLLLTGQNAEFGAPDPSTLVPVPPDCDTLCRRAIYPQPGGAFGSAEDMLAAFAEIAARSDDPAAWGAVSPAGTSRASKRRWPNFLAASAALVLGGVALWKWPVTFANNGPGHAIQGINHQSSITNSAGIVLLSQLPVAASPAEAAKDKPFPLPGGHYFLPVPGQPGVLLAATEVTRRQFEIFATALTGEESERLLPPIYDLDGKDLHRSNHRWTDTCPLPDDAAAGLNIPAAEAYCQWYLGGLTHPKARRKAFPEEGSRDRALCNGRRHAVFS